MVLLFAPARRQAGRCSLAGAPAIPYALPDF
jgi:hypothetical protein